MGSIWKPHTLLPHPSCPTVGVCGVTAQLLSLDKASVEIEFRVRHDGSVKLPGPASPVRTDNLWQTTCFEAFLKPIGGAGYREWNFSPSFAWAAYVFEGYRQGGQPLPVRLDPELVLTPHSHDFRWLELSAEFDLPPSIPMPAQLALSAVIEETDGTKSYWALAHPSDVPDFHHPDSFVLELPAMR